MAKKYCKNLTGEFSQFLIIALGAIPGALIRWQVNNDFLVNITGAAVFGLFMGFPLNRNLYLIIGIGFCGSLTTFSSWIVDCVKFFSIGDFQQAFSLFISTLLMGLVSSLFGFWLGRRISLTKLFQSQLLTRRYQARHHF